MCGTLFWYKPLSLHLSHVLNPASKHTSSALPSPLTLKLTPGVVVVAKHRTNRKACSVCVCVGVAGVMCVCVWRGACVCVLCECREWCGQASFCWCVCVCVCVSVMSGVVCMLTTLTVSRGHYLVWKKLPMLWQNVLSHTEEFCQGPIWQQDYSQSEHTIPPSDLALIRFNIWTLVILEWPSAWDSLWF